MTVSSRVLKKRRMRPGRTARCIVVWMLLGLLSSGVLACHSHAENRLQAASPGVPSGIWISREEIRSLPTDGPAWEALVAKAEERLGRVDLANQDDPNNIRILAKAMVFVRTGEERYALEVKRACREIRGTEKYADTLSIGRELLAYIIAADLVELETDERADFEKWLRRLANTSYRGRSIRSTHEDRPNNWGTHAGASRLALAAYLGDQPEIERAAHVFRGWTGEPAGWQRFEFGARWWQAKGSRPFAVNPMNARREGHPIGGVLPDDQRRAGPFKWPPPKENYVYEALQGAIVQAVLLERLGYESWVWGDRALLRAFEWLHGEANYPAQGDDTWLPHLINHAYEREFPAPVPSTAGKGMGFSDWTHGPRPLSNGKPVTNSD